MAVWLASSLTMSCRKTVDLAGSAWTASVVQNGTGGVYTPFSMTFLCNSDCSGRAFFVEKYENDPVPYGVSLPFSYVWDGEEGTLTLDDGISGIQLPLRYERAERNTLVVDFSPMHDYYPQYAGWRLFALERVEYCRTAQLDGSHWAFSYNPVLSDTAVDAIDIYELDFASSSAMLKFTRIQGSEGDTLVATWDIPEWHFSNGIGDALLRNTSLGVSFSASFYLPDAAQLLLFDGESMLPFASDALK